MKKSKRFLAMCLTICLLLSMGSVAFAAENAAQPKISVDQGIQDTAAYVLRTVKNPVVGSIGGEWAILGLARSGYNVPQSYFDNYVATVEKTVKEAKGELHKVKYTEYSRVILAFTSLGRDVTNIGGYNFLEKLADFNNVKKQGINGPIFALIALDSNQYEIPQVQGVSVQTTRDMLIDFILGREITDAKGTLGGFALSGNIPDPDITGMALQALAPYQTKNEKVAKAIERALDVLSNMQLSTGGFDSMGDENMESSNQVLTALSALGIDSQTDERFIKTDAAGKQNSLLAAMTEYFVTGGGFEHIKGNGVNGMASEQGLYGLVAYDRFKKGKSPLYDMTDVKGTVKTTPVTPATTEPKESKTTTSTGQTADLVFTDIANHWAKDKIEALRGLGITNGQSTFAPDKAITRAEFAVALVNAFGLEKKDGATVSFTDVPGNAWYQDAVLAAASQGIIKGKGNGLFEPLANITREEAMMLIQNTATLLKMNASTTQGANLNNFVDANQVSAWAKDAVIFNVNNEIIAGNGNSIAPTDNITRAETMVVIDRLLAKLSMSSQYNPS